MKRIDLLIKLVKKIYKLLKMHLQDPCCTTSPASNKKEVPFDNEVMNHIIQILERIEKQMHTFNQLATDYYALTVDASSPKELEKLMAKKEVLDYLKISERSYRRQVKSGLLQPMNFGGGDFYFQSQLEKAMLKSRNSGKL